MKIPGTHFCYNTRSRAWLGGLVLLKKLHDHIGNRTRDLPAYITVPNVASSCLHFEKKALVTLEGPYSVTDLWRILLAKHRMRQNIGLLSYRLIVCVLSSSVQFD